MSTGHLISESRQRRNDDCHVVCTCGYRADGSTPEAVAAAFKDHRREMRAPSAKGTPSGWRAAEVAR